MVGNPFEACRDRLARARKHETALAEAWNDFICAGDPYESSLIDHGDGIWVLEVWESRPMPTDFVLELGEWLYNARSCLDYVVWATAVSVSGQSPPPEEHLLQYPVYETLQAWDRNKYRLRALSDHHRSMLFRVQPFNGNADANWLRVLNHLARIDRHRRLTLGTAYLAVAEPVIEVSAGATARFQWGQRVLVDGRAQVARIEVKPWTKDSTISVNPRIGIDPEIQEWAESDFWARIRFSERLLMIGLFLEAEIGAYEYDCMGSSPHERMLEAEFRADCDARGALDPIERATDGVSWGSSIQGEKSTRSRFRGDDFPTGPEAVRSSGSRRETH